MGLQKRVLELPARGSYELAEWGSGSPVLCLHGFLDSWYSFTGLAETLPEGIHLLAPSQRGHGESWKPDTGYTIADMAGDAVQVIEALGLGSVTICGHSMGSLVAQEVASTRPDLVRGLVLLGSTISADTPDLRAAHKELAQLEDPVPPEVGREFQKSTCVGQPVGVEMDRIVDETAKVPAHVWDQAMAGTLDYRGADADVDLSGIVCPVQIVWGDQDSLFDRASQDALIAALPQATLTVLEGAGHGVHWERPEECAAALAALVSAKRNA